MSKHVLRLDFAVLLVLVVGLTAPSNSNAQIAKFIEHFSASATNVKPGTGETVKIDLLRLSTDAERDQMLAAFGKDPKTFLEALDKGPTVGYVWTSASIGFAIRYARRVSLEGGGDRWILVINSRLTSGGSGSWEATVQKSANDYPFTVIELRLDSAGGTGKMSLAANVAVEADTKTIALENYAAAPVMLRGVKKAS